MSEESKKIDKIFTFNFNSSQTPNRYLLNDFDFEIVNKRAKEGMPEAHFILSLFYYYGVHVTKNPTLAFHHCKEAEVTDGSLVLFFLAFYYYKGIGTVANLPLAYEYAKKSADKGCDCAKDMLAGMCYFGSGCKCDYKKAIEYAQRCGRLGYDISPYVLANAYFEGRCVEKDDELAKLWALRCIAGGGENASRAKSLLDRIIENIKKSHSLERNFWGFVPVNNYSRSKLSEIPAHHALFEYARGEYPIEEFNKNNQENHALVLYDQAAQLLKEDFAKNFDKAYDLLIKSAEAKCA